MYTVGYAWMYGFGFWSRSYTVFALSLFAHLAQMAFLTFIETPHIEKIYGGGNSDTNSSGEEGAEEDKAGVDGSAKSEKQRGDNIFVLHNFDIFRASDVSLVLVCTLTVLLFRASTNWLPDGHTCGGNAGGQKCLDTYTYKDGNYS